MAKLIYSMITSLDGYMEDADGKFDWSVPDEESHNYITELERSARTHLYGRRLYETMMVWETDTSFIKDSPYMQSYADMWQAADKIVYSRTLKAPSTRRTRLDRDFDVDTIRAMKAASDGELAIGGIGLASQAFRAGLVDEVNLFVAPVIIGGGKRALPDDLYLELELVKTHPFQSGMVHLQYRVSRGAP